MQEANISAELSIHIPQKKESLHHHIQIPFTTIGRSSGNNLKIDDPLASRTHCRIISEGDEFFIEDKGSKHGTYLNNERIDSLRPLKCGDKIRIGHTVMKFSLGEDKGKFWEDDSGDFTQTTTFSLTELIEQLDTGEDFEEVVPNVKKLRFQADAFAVLRDFSVELLTHTEVQPVLESTLQFVGKVVRGRHGILMLQSSSSDLMEARVCKSFTDQGDIPPVNISQSIINTVFENRASLITPDAQLDNRFIDSKSIFDRDIHSAICSPLWNNQNVIGLIYLDRGYRENPFTQEDLCLLSSLANMAAIKVQNIRLFQEALEKRVLEEQLALAADIQSRLLPTETPSIPGIGVAATHQSCLQIGGDYYDFFSLPDNRLALALGDVSGKGPSAALLMATLRASLCSQIRQGRNSAELFQNLNDFIYSSSTSGRFITFFFCEIDLDKRSLWYVNAGHNSPLIITQGSPVRKLAATGLPLGIFPQTEYEQGEAELLPESIFVLFTDGITETNNPAFEEFGEERLIECISRHHHSTAQEILDSLLEDLENFSEGETQNDDRTVVILKNAGPQ